MIGDKLMGENMRRIADTVDLIGNEPGFQVDLFVLNGEALIKIIRHTLRLAKHIKVWNYDHFTCSIIMTAGT